MRGVGDALADLGGDLLHRPLALGQQVHDLGPAAAGQRPGDLGEAPVQGVFGGTVSHAVMIRPALEVCQIFKRSLDKAVGWADDER